MYDLHPYYSIFFVGELRLVGVPKNKASGFCCELEVSFNSGLFMQLGIYYVLVKLECYAMVATQSCTR